MRSFKKLPEAMHDLKLIYAMNFSKGVLTIKKRSLLIIAKWDFLDQAQTLNFKLPPNNCSQFFFININQSIHQFVNLLII